MPIIHNNPLPHLLHLLRPNLQPPHQTRILLPLRQNRNHLPPFQRLLLLGQPAARRGQSGRHKRRAREHEADRAAVDLDAGEGGGVCVDEFEVWNWGAVLGLVEEGGGVYCVEGGFFGSVIGFWVSYCVSLTFDLCSSEWGWGEVAWWAEGTNNLIESSCAFFGRISSMNGSKPGYESRKFWRMPRCTEDLTLDFVLGAILSLSMLVSLQHGERVAEKSLQIAMAGMATYIYRQLTLS